MGAVKQEDWTMYEIAIVLRDAAGAIMNWLDGESCSEPARVWKLVNRLNHLTAAAMDMLVVRPPETGAEVITLESRRIVRRLR